MSTRTSTPSPCRARGRAAETSANPPLLAKSANSLVTKRTRMGPQQCRVAGERAQAPPRTPMHQAVRKFRLDTAEQAHHMRVLKGAVACGRPADPRRTNMHDAEERIRRLAYEFWLEEGMPEGRSQ